MQRKYPFILLHILLPANLIAFYGATLPRAAFRDSSRERDLSAPDLLLRESLVEIYKSSQCEVHIAFRVRRTRRHHESLLRRIAVLTENFPVVMYVSMAEFFKRKRTTSKESLFKREPLRERTSFGLCTLLGRNRAKPFRLPKWPIKKIFKDCNNFFIVFRR